MPILTSLLIFYFFLMAVHKLSTPSYSRDSTSQVPSGINCAIPLFSAYFSPKILALQAQQLLPASPSGPHLNGNKSFFRKPVRGEAEATAAAQACPPAQPLELSVSTQNCNSLNLTTNIRSYDLKIAAIKISVRTLFFFATPDWLVAGGLVA